MIRDFSDFNLTTITFGEIVIWNTTNRLELNHPTQRHSVWNISNATKFIESIIEKFPFEPIYVVKNRDRYSIIDGKQRISTLLLFIGGIEEELIYKDKSKKNDQSIYKNFKLSYYDLSNDFIEDYNIKEEDNIDYEYLQKIVPKFNNIISTLLFPCYISFQEDKELGDENNVFELFIRINSSGVSIENGEIIQANLLEKNNSNEFKHVIKNLEKYIYSKYEHLPRKRIWQIFAKIIYIYENKNKFLSGEFDSINLDENIERFITDLEPEKLNEWVLKFSELNEKLNKFLSNKNNNYNFFNKSSKMDAKPENIYLYSILIKMLDDNISEFIIDSIKKVVDSIQDKKSIFYYDEVIDKERNERKSRKLISKFDREPKKIKLGLFISNLDFQKFIIRGEMDYEAIRDNIIQKFI